MNKPNKSSGLNRSELIGSIRKFENWLNLSGYESYDPYDIWGTKYGLWSRAIYYERGLLGAPFISPILLIEALLPSARKLFVNKERFATADGQLILAWLNLYNVFDDESYLEKAVSLGEELLSYSIEGYSGLCWGYPFDWRHSTAITKRDTPLITSTPYCFEAYLNLYKVTNDQQYLEIIKSIAEFVHKDLNETPTGKNSTAGSYTPFDNGKVVNASCYRCWLLYEAWRQIGKIEYKEAAERNLNFILESQNEDGSWPYALGNPRENFIDNFHTCFNIKIYTR